MDTLRSLSLGHDFERKAPRLVQLTLMPQRTRSRSPPPLRAGAPADTRCSQTGWRSELAHGHPPGWAWRSNDKLGGWVDLNRIWYARRCAQPPRHRPVAHGKPLPGPPVQRPPG